MTDPRFIHLRVRSDYSMIDGLAKVESLVKNAAALNMPAMAITDFTNLCGLIKFYETAHNIGLKPIIGADFNIQNETNGNRITHITILAMNNIGYKNLILLISKAYQRGYSTLGPWIDRDWLKKYNEGILLLSGGMMGDVGCSLIYNNIDSANQHLDFYQKYFQNRFYLELIRTGRHGEEMYIRAAISIAEKRNLPVVATNDVRFIKSEDFYFHEIRVAIHNGFSLNDHRRPRNYSSQQYMKSEEEMCKLFADIPEALKNSIEIAKRCNVTICSGEYFLPNFPTEGMTTKDFFIKKSKDGLEKRLNIIFPNEKDRRNHRYKYDRRLNIELQIINQMGFPGYFLIVMEFIQWSKNNNIPVGPGRGSGASSLVAYALKITDIDPLKFNLLFERFLNPERISMPDLDIDFCMEKRDKVIEHVSEVYGHDAVSQIITFGTMAAKAAIRDVGRVLGHQYGFINRISKLVPSNSGMTLKRAFKIKSQLSEIYRKDEEVRILIDTAQRLEGVIRNVSRHAGGIVIAPTKITDFSPLYCDEDGQNQVTQFDKDDIGHVGLVKFDFLGLRTLTIIKWTLKMINKKREKNGDKPIDITVIPLDDKKSFDMLRRSETIAVFQLESRGMNDLIKRLQPDCFEDMIALIALFRPGPLQSGMVDNFINRKHGRENISYPDAKWQHRSLKSVLKSTYGIILYQEQIMQIAQVFAGYTLGEADVLRRAISKKNPKEMAKQRLLFEKGAKKNGIDGKLAIKIFNIVEKFADYGFNKSHSVAYALISYQTLWLKTHYPAEFMAAAMTADMDNTEKIVELVNECWRMGLKILPPDINSGFYYFHVNSNGEIVYGIGAIKGIGKSLIEMIIKERDNGGYFHELFDFCSRVNTKKVTHRVIEKLIMSGALDQLGPHRALLMNSLDNILKMANQYVKTEEIGQYDMFGLLIKEQKHINKFYAECQQWSEQMVLDNERAVLGLTLSDCQNNQFSRKG